MKKNILILLFIPIIFMGCQKNELDENNNDNQLDKEKILLLVNEAREKGCKCGSEDMPAVEPIKWNDKLEEAAQKHSDWMNKEDNLDHTGENGSSVGDRISETGYTFSTWGENIAWNYPNEEAVVEGWLESDGHCKNIMNASFTEMGVAKSDAYWTQVFATP